LPVARVAFGQLLADELAPGAGATSAQKRRAASS
jgi:hypothetical protein